MAELVASTAAVWQALLDGQWSITERYDADGRRFWVLAENDHTTRGLKKLTLVERHIVEFLVLGRAQKLIALELGMAESTVSKLAGSVSSKLGLKHRAELIELYSTLQDRSEALSLPSAVDHPPRAR